MSVTVRVPPVFRTLTSGSSQVDADGATVADVLASLEAAHPGFKDKLLDDQGSLVRYVNLFVDDDDVRFMDGLATPVPDGGTLSIMQAVAGG
jgi:sulfur-carrier protein